jgi:hypothetical protein
MQPIAIRSIANATSLRFVNFLDRFMIVVSLTVNRSGEGNELDIRSPIDSPYDAPPLSAGQLS